MITDYINRVNDRNIRVLIYITLFTRLKWGRTDLGEVSIIIPISQGLKELII